MIKFPKTLAAASLLVALAFTVPAAAAETTASDDYQVIDTINAELTLIHKANGSKPKPDHDAPVLTERRPRHVIQKAREVLNNVEILHDMQEIEREAVPAFTSDHEVTDEDVKIYLEHILSEVRKLTPTYGVKKHAAKAPLPKGKTDTDVYAHLEEINLSLEGLGIREVRPFDVYREIMVVIHDLELMREARGVTGKIDVGRTKGKSAGDVYEGTFQILADLKALTESSPKYKIPGGVVMPNKRSGELTPEHTMDLLDEVLGETSALKVTLGVNKPSMFSMPKSGRMPTNAFDAVQMARALVKSLKG